MSLLAALPAVLLALPPSRQGDGETVERAPRIHLEAGSFDPLRERLDFRASGLAEEPPPGGTAYAVVQLRPGVPGGRERLAAAGVVLGSLGEGSFQVRLDAAGRRRLLGDPAVRFVGDWLPAYKVSTRLYPVDPGSPLATPDVTLVPFADASAVKLARKLEREVPGVLVTFASDSILPPRARLSVPFSVRADFLRRASLLEGVAWVEPYVEPRLLNIDASGPIQGNAPSPDGRTIFARGLTGTGQIVAVSDTGCDDDQCFFRNLNGVKAVTDASDTFPPEIGPLFPDRKVVGYWVLPGATAYDNNATCGSRNDFHGTHTSGTTVGDSDAHPSTPTDPGVDVGDGMAPNAQLLVQDVGNDLTGCLTGTGDNYGMLLQALRGGARVHSVSWGASTDGAYTSDDYAVDRFLFDHEGLVSFFSAGNDGKTGTTGTPANSKNAVAVGAVGHGNSTALASYSSKGPTKDGRIKPDLVAPGTGTVSARGNADHTDGECVTQALSGTSMSCPTAAGGTALLRQYFADGYHPTGKKNPADAFDVPGPLAKAVLLGGTVALPAGGAFGGFDFGWGRIYLGGSLPFEGDARRLRAFSLANADGLTTGEARTFTVRVAAGQELRAALAWYDAEGTLGAESTIVNDLDLEVTDGKTTWLGNVFDGTGASVLGGNRDRKNTVEQVRLPSPAEGTYTVTVRAASVPGNGRTYTARQGFGLAILSAASATAVTSAPPPPLLASDAVMGTDVTVSPAPGSTVTHVYRAEGGCDAAAASYRWVGSTTSASFVDARAQGGKLYGYKLRGGDPSGEGPLSGCAEITPAGRCDLVPEFAGIASAVAGSPECKVTVAWTPGKAECTAKGGALRYNVYRATSPGFVASPDTYLTTVEGKTSLVDFGPGLPAGRTWFYSVQAEDTTSGGPGPHGGNREPGGRVLFAAPYGPEGPVGTFTDDAADGVATLSSEGPWTIATGGATGLTSYLCGVPGGTYPPNTCASIVTPALTVSSGAVLGYWARWNLELEFDGVVVEISGDGGATWKDLPPSGGYPGTLAQTDVPPINACGLPASTGAFTGPPGNLRLTDWARFESPIPSSHDGRTIRIRWRFTSDPGMEYEGFYLDGITVTNVRGPLACTPVSHPVVPGPGGGQGGVLPGR